ncbi:MAG TPA: hypothetical protein VGJ21_25560 [Terracidiphilus sp.]|jgi:hypothetical protein
MAQTPLMKELFSKGIMQMGPSRVDPARQVGVFNLAALAGFPALRAAEMEKFRWITGEWDSENLVPATDVSPAYCDIGIGRYAIDARGEWVCMVSPEGAQTPQITFDPFSHQWIYVLMRGAYGMLRSPEGWTGDRIEFHGVMTMLGPDREWRLTWTRESPDRFSFVNEELLDGEWLYIDEWRFTRRP